MAAKNRGCPSNDARQKELEAYAHPADTPHGMLAAKNWHTENVEGTPQALSALGRKASLR